MGAADRTEAKLTYANLMLRELQAHRGLDGDDFQRSHEEAFLFHLHGALEAFLQEINEHCNCGILAHQVSISRLENELRRQSKTCPQLTEIRALKRRRSGQWRPVRSRPTRQQLLPECSKRNGKVPFFTCRLFGERVYAPESDRISTGGRADRVGRRGGRK
jgi:hypothetical protein